MVLFLMHEKFEQTLVKDIVTNKINYELLIRNGIGTDRHTIRRGSGKLSPTSSSGTEPAVVARIPATQHNTEEITHFINFHCYKLPNNLLTDEY